MLLIDKKFFNKNMKILLSIVFSVVICMTGMAYGDIQIITDKEKYNTGETITISGNVLTPNESELVSVGIQIFDPTGNIIQIAESMPNENGYFTESIVSEEPSWKNVGYYKIKITYGKETLESGFWFNQEPTSQTIESVSIATEPQLTQHDQDIERLQLEINKRDNRIAELENQVIDLEKEVANLNMIIQEQIKVIMETLISLKIG